MGLEKSLSWFACTLCVRRVSGTGEDTVMVCMYFVCEEDLWDWRSHCHGLHVLCV